MKSVKNEVWEQVEDQRLHRWDQIESQIQDQVQDQTMYHLWIQVEDPVRDQVLNRVWTEVEDQP